MKYILFDLDGTLVDSSLGITRCFEYSFRKMGHTPPPPEELRSRIGPPLFDSFLLFFEGNKERALQGVKFYRERYAVEGWKECTLYPNVTECLQSLVSSGKKLALATSKPQNFAEKILSHFEIIHYFSAVVGSKLDNSFDDKGKIIQKAMDLLDAEKSRTVMVGDRRQDIVGAAKNGVRSVGIRVGFAEKGELEEAGATYFAEDFRSLKKLLFSL